jgi:hypothetical protein
MFSASKGCLTVLIYDKMACLTVLIYDKMACLTVLIYDKMACLTVLIYDKMAYTAKRHLSHKSCKKYKSENGANT